MTIDALTSSSTIWRTRLWSLLATVALWEVAARVLSTPHAPPFSTVAVALYELVTEGLILANLVSSLVNLSAGVVIASIAGLGTGIALARSRHLALVAEPYLNGLLAAPSLVFVPILYSLFGATRTTQIGSVVLHAVFIIAATTLAALRTPDPALVAMAVSFGASERQLFWKIRWPKARPMLVSGVGVGVLFGVKGMINGETFIALTGLGALVRLYGGRFEADRLIAILLVISGVALVCSWTVEALAPRTRTSQSRG